MSINQPESVVQQAPEHSAAVNEVSEETSLQAFSETFYIEHIDLFREPVGLVAQVGNPLDERVEGIPQVEQIVLDARGSDDGVYAWEITHGGGKFTKKWHLIASGGGIEGTYTELIQNGAFWRRVELGVAELAEQEAYLRDRLESDEVVGKIAAIREIRTKQQERINAASSESERIAQHAQLKRLGFVAMTPFKYNPEAIPAAFAPDETVSNTN